MEIIFELLLLLLEAIGPAVLEILMNLAMVFPDNTTVRTRRYYRVVLYGAIGMFFGAISKLIFPSLLLNSPALQMLSILVMPFLVAYVVWKISLWIDLRRRNLYYRNYWMYYWFTFAYLLTRSDIFSSL